jgi:hypothetical protein
LRCGRLSGRAYASSRGSCCAARAGAILLYLRRSLRPKPKIGLHCQTQVRGRYAAHTIQETATIAAFLRARSRCNNFRKMDE